MKVKYKIVIRPHSPLAEIYKEIIAAVLPGDCPILLCGEVEQGCLGFLRVQLLKYGEDEVWQTVHLHPSEVLLISDAKEPDRSPIGFLPVQ